MNYRQAIGFLFFSLQYLQKEEWEKQHFVSCSVYPLNKGQKWRYSSWNVHNSGTEGEAGGFEKL